MFLVNVLKTRMKKMPDIMIMILINTNLTITMKIKIIIAVFWRFRKKKKNLPRKIWAATSNYQQHSRYLLFSLFIENISLFLISLNPPAITPLVLTKFGICLSISAQVTSIVLISSEKWIAEGTVAQLFWQTWRKRRKISIDEFNPFSPLKS